MKQLVQNKMYYNSWTLNQLFFVSFHYFFTNLLDGCCLAGLNKVTLTTNVIEFICTQLEQDVVYLFVGLIFFFWLCVQVQRMWVFNLIWVFAFFVLQLYSSIAVMHVF